MRKLWVLYAKIQIYSLKEKYTWSRAHADESFEVNASEERVFFGSRQIHWGSRFDEKKKKKKL